MAKVAVNTGSIGETSYRADGLFGNQVSERDIIDLRNSSHKVQDYKRLLEREFNKAVSGKVRGEEGEWEVVENTTLINNTALSYLTDGCTYFRSASGTYISDENNESLTEGVYTQKIRGLVKGISGNWYKLRSLYNQSGYTHLALEAYYGDVRSDFTVGGDYQIMLSKRSTRKKSNTLLHCDIIGNPANYYRGQNFIDSGTHDIAIGDVVWAKTASGGGTAGNFYKALTVQASIDLATQDYSNATNWVSLGADWDGPGSWRTGISGTPLVVGENGEDLIPSGSSKTTKYSKKVITNKLTMWSLDNGVNWTTTTAYNADNITNSFTATLDPKVIVLHFYKTHTNMTENAVNSEVLALGDAFATCQYLHGVLSQSLLNKSLIGNHGPSVSNGVNVGNYSLGDNTRKLVNVPTHASIIPPIAVDITRPKVLPYITKENGKAYLQLVFKEMKYDVDWGDDSKFNIVDNVSTTTDDNGNTVLIGQKRIELPYFIEDKE